MQATLQRHWRETTTKCNSCRPFCMPRVQTVVPEDRDDEGSGERSEERSEASKGAHMVSVTRQRMKTCDR